MRVVRVTSTQQQSGSIPNKWGWPESPQPSSNLINSNNLFMISEAHLPSSDQPSHFLPRPDSSMSSSLYVFLWPSTSNSNTLLKAWLSSLLYTWPYQHTLLAMANWSIAWLKPQICINSLALSYHWAAVHISLSLWISLSFKKFSCCFLSGNMLQFDVELLAGLA